MSNITDNLQAKNNLQQDAQRVRMSNANIFDGPRSPSMRNPLPTPVETIKPAFQSHDVANGIRETAPGVYESAPQQTAGRVMPRPDMAAPAPLQNVGTPALSTQIETNRLPNGIRRTAPGVYESTMQAPAQQTAGRVMPRPDMATTPLQNVGTPAQAMQIETTNPQYTQGNPANGIRQQASGVYESAPQQNPGRVMPRPDMATSAPLQNVGTPSQADTMRAQGATQQAATQARLAARVPPAPVAPSAAAPVAGPEDFGRNLGKGVRSSVRGVAGTALSGAAAAVPFAEQWDAYGDDSGLSNSDKLQLLARHSVKAGLGLAGGAVGATVGSVAGLGGTIAGGAALGIAGYNAADPVMDDIRGGANWINGKLGGDDKYWKNTDDILRNKGFDPNHNIVDMAMGRGSSKLQVQAQAPASTVNPAPTPTAVRAPSATDAFNKTLAERGAGDIAMTADAQGNRMLSNVGSKNPFDTGLRSSGPMSSDQAMFARSQRDSAEQALQTGYAKSAADRQMQAGASAGAPRGGDTVAFGSATGFMGSGSLRNENSNSMAAAIASGSAPRLQAAQSQQEASMRDAATRHDTDTRNAATREGNILQAATTLRGQDSVAGSQRAANMLGMYTAQRDQGNKNREFDLASNKNSLDAKREGQKSLQERIAASTQDGPDGKPDTQAVAQKNAAVTEYMSARSKALEKFSTAHPGADGDQARGEMKTIREQAHAGIGDIAFHQITTGIDAANAAKQYHSVGLAPWGGRAVETNAPIKSLRKVSSWTGDYYVSDRGDEIPARVIDKDGSFIGGKKNIRYDSLKIKD